jgi:hypothetical protein
LARPTVASIDYRLEVIFCGIVFFLNAGVLAEVAQ